MPALIGRSVVAVLAGSLVPGCAGRGEPAPEMTVINSEAGGRTVQITITHAANGSTVLSETHQLAVDETVEYGEELRAGTKYRLDVEVEDGPHDGRTWDTGEGDGAVLHVLVVDGSISFETAVE